MNHYVLIPKLILIYMKTPNSTKMDSATIDYHMTQMTQWPKAICLCSVIWLLSTSTPYLIFDTRSVFVKLNACVNKPWMLPLQQNSRGKKQNETPLSLSMKTKHRMNYKLGITRSSRVWPWRMGTSFCSAHILWGIQNPNGLHW